MQPFPLQAPLHDVQSTPNTHRLLFRLGNNLQEADLGYQLFLLPRPSWLPSTRPDRRLVPVAGHESFLINLLALKITILPPGTNSMTMPPGWLSVTPMNSTKFG